jgi:hypothetical protein
MKRFLLWLLFFILTIYIFNSCSCERKEYINSVEQYKKSNIIIDYIDNNYIQNIIYIGLYELKIDSVIVNLYYLPNNLKSIYSDNKIYIINALILKNVENNYSIFVNNNSINDNKIIQYIAHELIHLQQFKTNRLIIYNTQNLIRFDNKLYFTLETNYESRPWEIEAFDKQNELRMKIISKLN